MKLMGIKLKIKGISNLAIYQFYNPPKQQRPTLPSIGSQGLHTSSNYRIVWVYPFSYPEIIRMNGKTEKLFC